MRKKPEPNEQVAARQRRWRQRNAAQGLKRREFMLSDTEAALVRQYIDTMRETGRP